MRKIGLMLGTILVLGFIILQFFAPPKNEGEIGPNHIFNQEQVPENIKTTLKEACLDCHSNQTRYTWYHFMPVAIAVNKHIIEGKDELNFSEWGTMDFYEKITSLEEICQETERNTMPLKSYTIMHPKSNLKDEQIAELCDWTSKLAEELLAKETSE
jgi:cytochrome c553